MVELSQGVHGVAYDVRDDGVIDFIDDEGNFSRMQDITEILRANHFLQGEDSPRKPFFAGRRQLQRLP